MVDYKKILSKITPYIIIFVFSILGTYLVFYKGINYGDDYNFHIANFIEQYETFISGNKLSPISGIIGAGLGSGTRLFYSPLPHLTVSLLSVFYRLFDLSIIDAYKSVLVLSVFVSGVFMYRFAMHFTSDNKIASLIAAACFVLYPYRLFDAYCRFAFAEAYCFIFLPLFFMGLYDITHIKDKVTTLPFVEVILGGGLLFLSHNITAFYTFIVGIIYLLCNIKGIVKAFKKKNYLLYCGVAIFLLAGIGSIAFVSQFELLSSGLYNISDRVRMWTNVEKVITRTKEEFNYSGFLNIPFLTGKFSNVMVQSSLIIGIIMYIVSCGIFIVVDRCLKEIKKLRYFNHIISIIVLFALISLVSRRLEIYLATIIFYVLYQYISFSFSRKDIDDNSNDKIYKNVMFWFSIVMIIILFVMMEEEWVWKVLPSFFLNIQFPWRLWAIVQLLVSMLLGLIAYYFNYKSFASITLSILVGLLMVTNMPLLEKRLYYENYYDSSWHAEVEYNLLDSGVAMGWNKEYLPQVFFDKNYKVTYKGSLYKKVRNILQSSNSSRYGDYSIDPTFLTGNANIEVVEAYAPTYTMNIEVLENETIIQMALIYYPGYEITATNLVTNEVIKLDGENIDGLVSFALNEGKYLVTTDFVGSSARKASVVWFSISLGVTALGLVYSIIERKREKKYVIQESK